MNQIIINVDPDECANLQYLSGRERATRSLISLLLSTSIDDSLIVSPAFNEYHKEYMKRYGEFDSAKKELENKYIPEDIRIRLKMWFLDYYTRELKITLKKEEE